MTSVEVTLYFWETPRRQYRDGGWNVDAAPPSVTQVKFRCLLIEAHWGQRHYLVNLAEALTPVPPMLPRAIAHALKAALDAMDLPVAQVSPGVVVMDPPLEL
jgi:hypothetical protein